MNFDCSFLGVCYFDHGFAIDADAAAGFSLPYNHLCCVHLHYDKNKKADYDNPWQNDRVFGI